MKVLGRYWKYWQFEICVVRSDASKVVVILFVATNQNKYFHCCLLWKVPRNTLVGSAVKKGWMPSPYNLRTRSSTSVSPVKRERATVKKTKKPKTESEKDEKNSLTGDRKIQNVEQVPNVIVEALLQLQIESLDDLAQLNLDDLQVSVEKLITTVQDQPTNQSLLVETMRRKIIKAWMGSLASLSKDGVVKGDWRKFLEMTSEGEKNGTYE